MSGSQTDHNIFGKTEILFALIFAISGGAFFSSAVDLFSLSYADRFPYRLPFNEIILHISVLIFVLALILFIIHLVRKQISWKNKMVVLIVVGFLAGGLAVMTAILWWLGIEMIHDFKREYGFSHE